MTRSVILTFRRKAFLEIPKHMFRKKLFLVFISLYHIELIGCDDEPIKINPIECGLTKKLDDPHSRIVGGIPIDIKEAPWMVSFQKVNKDKRQHFCGGAVINKRWLLSAAHCIHGVKHSIDRVRAVLGSTKWNTSEGQTHTVDKTVVHEEYDPSNYANDIALVKTAEDIEFTVDDDKYEVNSVCLVTKDIKVSRSAKIYGWGVVGEFKSRSDKLRKTTLETFDSTKCGEIYKQYIGQLNPHMMCYWSKGKDACQGDSGGPLTQQIKGREYQIGMISFGLGCGRTDHPGIYTKVSDYIEWIENTIENN